MLINRNLKRLFGLRAGVIGIMISVVVVAGYAYLKNNVICYDGYGSGRYVTKSEFITKLDSVRSGPNELDVMINGLDKVAFESYRCGDTKYMIRDGNKFREVSQARFQQYLTRQPVDLIKVTQSGNSPYLFNNFATGNKNFVDQKNGKYILMEKTK